MANPKGCPRGMTRADVQRRRERIFARYLDGLSERQVAREFGLSCYAVHVAIQHEVARRGVQIVRPQPRPRELRMILQGEGGGA